MKSEDTVAYVFEFLKLGGQEGVHESISGPFKKNYFASLFKYFIIFKNHLPFFPGSRVSHWYNESCTQVSVQIIWETVKCTARKIKGFEAKQDRGSEFRVGHLILF